MAFSTFRIHFLVHLIIVVVCMITFCSELLAKERNDLYWRFLEQWLATDESIKHHTDRECVQYIVEKGSSLLGGPLSPLFRFSLSLRSASPKVVMYRQLATESLAVYNSGRKVMLVFLLHIACFSVLTLLCLSAMFFVS